MDTPTIDQTVLARETSERIRENLRGHKIKYSDPTTIEQIDTIGKALAPVSEDRRSKLLDTLYKGFNTIARLGHSQKMTLYADTAPLSFAWGGAGWFGGLIFHGAHDGGGDGGGPSFSVCLTPQDGWSIHT